MAEPIKAADLAARGPKLPDVVFEAFNELIEAHFDGNSSKVMQDDVIQAIVNATGVRRVEVFDKGWLNVETAYRNAGWQVRYDSPGYNESYPAYFMFTAR